MNAKNVDGLTPLHVAAATGQKEIAELLIAIGANVNAKDNNGVFHGYGRCEVQNDQAQEQERASSHGQQGGSKMEPLSKSSTR